MIVLQNLAGSDQMRHPAFPGIESIPHELILGFAQARSLAEAADGSNWTLEQKRVIASIDTALKVAGSASNAAVWSRQAVPVAPCWMRICELSRIALRAFGWPAHAVAGYPAYH